MLPYSHEFDNPWKNILLNSNSDAWKSSKFKGKNPRCTTLTKKRKKRKKNAAENFLF